MISRVATLYYLSSLQQKITRILEKQQNMAHMQQRGGGGGVGYKLESCQSKAFLYIVKIKLVLLHCLKLLVVIPKPAINNLGPKGILGRHPGGSFS